MSLMQPSFPGHFSPRQESHESHASFPIPMIYEQLPASQPGWEYHVFTVDATEGNLPDVEQLNKLGHDGWIMVALLDERMTGRGSHVHYYFTRQVQEDAK